MCTGTSWTAISIGKELVIENHAQHLKELGRRHGLGLSIEPYDMDPTSDLDLDAVADVPMGEFWSDGFGFDSAFSCFEAASIAHIPTPESLPMAPGEPAIVRKVNELNKDRNCGRDVRCLEIAGLASMGAPDKTRVVDNF